MSAGITLGEGSELSGLRIAGNIAFSQSKITSEQGIKRFSSVSPSTAEIVALFGTLRYGDLLAPFPLILSKNDDEIIDHSRPIYNNPNYFRANPESLFVLVETKVQPHVFSFLLLSASPSREKMAWFHLSKRKVTEILMKG